VGRLLDHLINWKLFLGEVKTIPLEHFSVLQEVSVLEMLGLNFSLPFTKFSLQLNMNLHTPLKIDPRAYLVIDTKDEGAQPSFPNRCYSLSKLNRWRLDISPYQTFDDYVQSLARWHRCTYNKAKKNFFHYGCETTYIEGDWSEHAETVARLYGNTARNYNHCLFNEEYFREVAKHSDCSLLCALYKGEMISAFVLKDELPTMHSLCCGLDYKHSSESYTYSWMHYALLQHAITAKKYKILDVGFTADEAKKAIGFQLIPSRMDLYSRGKLTQAVLSAVARYFGATLSAEGKVKLFRPQRSSTH
jgi:predicted N-acyltransferase